MLTMTMTLAPDQVLALAGLVREHEPTDVHVAKSMRDPGTLDVDLYREEDVHWRCTASISEHGVVREAVTAP